MFIDIFDKKYNNSIKHKPCHFCGNEQGNCIETIISRFKYNSKPTIICYNCAKKYFGCFYHIYEYQINDKKNKQLILDLQVCHCMKTMIFKHEFFNVNMKTMFAGLNIDYMISDINDEYICSAGYSYDYMTIPSKKEFFENYHNIKKRIDSNKKIDIDCHDFLLQTGYENMMASIKSFNMLKHFGF